MGLWNQPGTSIVIATSQPSVTPEGQIWYDASNDILYVSDGTTFNEVGSDNSILW